MATFGDGYIGITPQPSRSPSTQSTRSNRHGSAEQLPRDVFGRASTFATEMPRTPRRVRSPGDDRDEDRRRDREDWRERRRQQSIPINQEPLGINFRLTAIEQTLKEHFAEIASHKLAIEEVRPTAKGLTDMEGRLNMAFGDWNNRLTGLEKSNGLALQSVREDVTSVVGAHANRIDRLEAEVTKLVARIDSVVKGIEERFQSGASTPPGIPVDHRQAPPMNQTGPPMPQSWSPLSAPNPTAQPEVPDPWCNGLRPNQGATNIQSAWSQWRPSGSAPTNGPTMFGMASPPPATQQPPMQQANSWAAGFGTNFGPWVEKDWKVDHKVSSELKVFDGQIQHYANWRNRIRDHFISTNVYYSEVFDLIEQTKNILTLQTLNDARVPTLPNVHWRWLASHLWTFIGKWMTNGQLDRRITLASGEEYNGVELWRALFVEYHGGSVEMSKCERGYFINFPKCAKDEELQGHVQQWNTLRLKYGNGLPEDHIILMFHEVLPEHVSKEIRNQKDLVTINQQVNWVTAELSRFNDSRLSKWNMQRLTQQLKGASTKMPTSIQPVMSETQSPLPDAATAVAPPIPDMATLQASMERMIAAAIEKGGGRDRGRGGQRTPSGSRTNSPANRRSNIPSPKFAGCWCCGKSGHARKDCNVFKSIREKNGGQVPKDYEGAYEKHLKAQKASKAPVAAISAAAQSGNHDETYMWPVITAKGNIRPPGSVATPIQNQYEALDDGGEDSDDQDESEVLRALSQITSNVSYGKPKPKSPSKAMTMAKISAIAKQISSGAIRLPDLDLANNAEYDCCWALVDSGAGVNVAKDDQFVDSVDVEAPEVILSTADGALLPNSGAMKVTTRSKEGITVERVFYKAPVAMPILAVAELTKEGDMGSTTGFRQRDGYIENNADHQRQHFVKRKGVYFMKLYTRKRSNGFVRPEKP